MIDLLEMIVSRMKINVSLIAKIEKVIESMPEPLFLDSDIYDEIRILEKEIDTIKREQYFLDELITGEEIKQ